MVENEDSKLPADADSTYAAGTDLVVGNEDSKLPVDADSTYAAGTDLIVGNEDSKLPADADSTYAVDSDSTYYAAGTGCSNVDAIHVVWSEIEPPSSSLQAYLKKSVHLKSKIGTGPTLGSTSMNWTT